MNSSRVWALPATGGLIALAVAFGNRLLVGAVYSQANAAQLIENLARSGLYFGAAVVTSSATILALMLTLLGFAKRIDADFDNEVFLRINRIGTLSTVSFCGALGLLMLLTLPVGEFEQLPDHWFPMLYNVLIGFVGLLTSLLIMTVLLLFSTVRHVIAKVTPPD